MTGALENLATVRSLDIQVMRNRPGTKSCYPPMGPAAHAAGLRKAWAEWRLAAVLSKQSVTQSGQALRPAWRQSPLCRRSVRGAIPGRSGPGARPGRSQTGAGAEEKTNSQNATRCVSGARLRAGAPGLRPLLFP